MAITAKATQEFVPIKEVRDGVVILKDSSLRAILMTSSINFGLKSEDNQNAIILQFQNFLNSLDFSVQISVESRRFDIKPYIALLEDRYKNQTGDLLKIQTREYIEFVKSFTENTNIMTKVFFVVIPYSPAILNAKGGIRGLTGKLTGDKGAASESAKTDSFEEGLSQLEQRISIVEQGLVRSGIRSVRLGTEEIVELFYKLFNPGETEAPAKIEA